MQSGHVAMTELILFPFSFILSIMLIVQFIVVIYLFVSLF
ncbi:putative orphan protein [Pseudoalteromonas translucida]|uniref:Orphan protein n=1 Tax=Pseudoalteromonas translucida (strain TAC 125) TaxID=326442 RepID=Q3IEK7_PSET1|nr:putative orphan protein [Pseudoalteromonas translucida]